MALKPIDPKYKGRDIYSFSKLDSFHNCEFGWFKTYIEKNRGLNKIYGVFGSECHSLLESLQSEEITKEEAMAKFNDMVLQLDLDGLKFPTPNIEVNILKAIRHYIAGYDVIKCDKYLMEKEFYLEIDEIVVRGFIDLITLNKDGTVEIYDYKTSSAFAKKDMYKKGRQLVIYAMWIEQKFPKYKIEKLYWDMLKYVYVKYGKRNRLIARDKLVKELEKDIRKKLGKLDIDDVDLEMLMDEAFDNNSIEGLPKEVTDTYIIEKAFVEYEYTEEAKAEVVEWVKSTVATTKALSQTDENEWKPKDIFKENFFCSMLCGHSDTCKYYKQYIASEFGAVLDTKKELDEEFDDLFS